MCLLACLLFVCVRLFGAAGVAHPRCTPTNKHSPACFAPCDRYSVYCVALQMQARSPRGLFPAVHLHAAASRAHAASHRHPPTRPASTVPHLSFAPCPLCYHSQTAYLQTAVPNFFTEKLLKLVAEVARVIPPGSDRPEHQFPLLPGSHLTPVRGTGGRGAAFGAMNAFNIRVCWGAAGWFALAGLVLVCGLPCTVMPHSRSAAKALHTGTC